MESKKRGSNLERVVTQLPALFTLLGIVFYVALRSTYGRFYGAFGLKPEDVGLGYIATLSRSPGAVALFLGVAASLGSLWSLGWFEAKVRPVDATVGLTVIVASVAMAGACIGFVVAGLYGVSRVVQAVKDGSATCSATVGPFLFVEVPTPHVEMDWLVTSPSIPTLQKDPAKDKLMYLGSGRQEEFFWDVTTQRTVQVPSSDVLIRIDPHHEKCVTF